MTDNSEPAREAVAQWRYSINYGPDGEANYANVHAADGQFVGNLRTHHAIAICNAFAVCEKLASPPAPAAGGLEAVREAMRGAEAAFEAIRIILVNELDEPVRQAFWRAVQARDASRAALAAAAASRGEDWRPVLTDMVAAMNKRDSDFGDGDIPSAHRSLMWRAEQLLASPAATSAETQGAVELLRKLEEACDNAAGKRSQATYDQMISDPGAEDALEELDIARREARIFLNPDLWRRANGER